MGSGIKGLYSGTRGSRVHMPKDNAKRMRSEATNWANQQIDKLAKQSNKKREKFTTASLAYDSESGKYFYGRNKGIEMKGDKKNPLLFSENGILPEKSLNNYPVGNCAEVDAINQALNSGAKLENITIYTIHTTKGHVGRRKEACENCTFAFKGKIKKNHTGWKSKGK